MGGQCDHLQWLLSNDASDAPLKRSSVNSTADSQQDHKIESRKIESYFFKYARIQEYLKCQLLIYNIMPYMFMYNMAIYTASVYYITCNMISNAFSLSLSLSSIFSNIGRIFRPMTVSSRNDPHVDSTVQASY